MKFLCDRCKTRYSIGDDRVRGKILKIRCKNCANVITVREGMPNPDAAEAAPAPQGIPRRVQKTTTAAPAIQSEAPAPPAGELDAEPASATAKPPPALEEEWYVSIDGEQVGPFSLGDAQRWVADHPVDADLHCWNEGFDDWLPVDKVRHFRGLRKKPAAAPAPAPAPAPRVPTPARPAAAAVRPAPRPPSEDEPKPLFAATMAQLEKGSAPSDLRGLGMAGLDAPALGGGGPPVAASAGLGVTGAPGPSPLRALGSTSVGRPLNGHVPMPARPNGAALQAKATPVSTAIASGAGSATDRPARGVPVHVATQPGFGLAPPLAAFDASEAGDSATQLEAPAFDPGPAALIAPAADAGDVGDDDDLDIGEVSRVVKLADLAKAAAVRPQPAAAAARPGASAVNRAGPEGAVAKDRARLQANRTGPVPSFGVPGSGLLADAGDPMAFAGGAAGPQPAAAVSHRRGMIALIAGAIVLVGVAVAVVFFFVLADQEEAGSRLGRVDEIDTTRPDEVRRAGSGGSATATPADPPPNPFVPKPKPPVTPPPVTPPDPPGGGNKLEAREIEEMAGKNSSVTQRCYMRAQRGAEGILLSDVKKIAVTLTINGDGAVTDAQLSDNQAASSLGKCLLTSIRSWKFRASPGGTFRFILHFG